MHDGIHVENAGIPSATICTDRFVPTATGMARMWGAADYPTIYTEHPIENLSPARPCGPEGDDLPAKVN